MTGFFDLPGWALPLARRVLYFWVRPTVFPENPQELGLDPAKPVCYVLQDHHLSSLLVLFKESQSAGLPAAIAPLRIGSKLFPHAAFFLNRKHSLSATARQRYAHSTLMTALMREALANPEALEFFRQRAERGGVVCHGTANIWEVRGRLTQDAERQANFAIDLVGPTGQPAPADLALSTLGVVRRAVLSQPDAASAWFTQWALQRYHPDLPREDLAQAEGMIDFEFWAAVCERAQLARARPVWLAGLLPGVDMDRPLGEVAAIAMARQPLVIGRMNSE